MKNTTKIGNLTVMKVTVALMERNEIVLLPAGEGLYYDLLIDKGQGTFDRVQCKTGKMKKGVILFNNYSSTAAGTKLYGTKVEQYGVYCPQNKKVYLVPSVDCKKFKTALRVDPPKNGRTEGFRWAKDYEV